VIKLTDIEFTYGENSFRLHIPLLEIISGDTLAITGRSGSGKSTLLNIISGILIPQGGKVQIDDVLLSDYPFADRQDFRLLKMGLVFQEFELLEYLDLLDNVLLPYYMSPLLELTPEVKDRARELLTLVGLEEKYNRKPANLSQGERQRVAVCRALVTQPPLVLSDEPTGNLDAGNRDIVINALTTYAEESGATLVVVTHDMELIPSFQSRLDMGEFINNQI
jgi:putative ABC transport system ATP-binding protein